MRPRMRRGMPTVRGGETEEDVSHEALVDELRCEERDDRQRDIRLLDLAEVEADRSVGNHHRQQLSVDVRLRFFRLGGAGRQGVTNRVGRADDPTRQDTAVGSPVGRIEDPTHVEVGIAGEDALVMPWVEFLVGLALILGVWRREAAALTGLLILVFIAAIHSAGKSREALLTEVRWVLVRDAAILLMGAQVLTATRKPTSPPLR